MREFERESHILGDPGAVRTVQAATGNDGIFKDLVILSNCPDPDSSHYGWLSHF